MFSARFAKPVGDQIAARFETKTAQMSAGFDGTTEKNEFINDYGKLRNLPRINHVELRGDMDADTLGLQSPVRVGTIKDIEKLFYGG